VITSPGDAQSGVLPSGPLSSEPAVSDAAPAVEGGIGVPLVLQTEAAVCCAAWKLKGRKAWHWPSDALRQAAMHIERQLPDRSALWHNRSMVLAGCTAHSNCDLVLPPASILPV